MNTYQQCWKVAHLMFAQLDYYQLYTARLLSMTFKVLVLIHPLSRVLKHSFVCPFLEHFVLCSFLHSSIHLLLHVLDDLSKSAVYAYLHLLNLLAGSMVATMWMRVQEGHSLFHVPLGPRLQ